MNMKSQQLCPKCRQEYSCDNPPKLLINCPHSLCLSCLSEEITCPIDRKRIQRRKYTIEAFQTNQALLDSILHSKQTLTNKQTDNHTFGSASKCLASPNQKDSTLLTHKPSKPANHNNSMFNTPTTTFQQNSSFQSPKRQPTSSSAQVHGKAHFQTCLLHSKKANLICIQDKKLICADCGLFGEHKPHELITYQKFVEQYSALTEECFQIYKQLQERDLDPTGFQMQLNDLLAKKREQEMAKIRKHVRLFSDLLKAMERQLIANLDIAIDFKRQKLKENVSLDELITKREEYMGSVQQMSEGLSHLFNPQNLEQYISFLDCSNPNSLLHKAGLYLLVEIDNHHKNASEKMHSQVQQFQYQFKVSTPEFFQSTYAFKSIDSKLIDAAINETKQRKQQQLNTKLSTPCRPVKSMASQNIKKESPLPAQDQTLLLEHNSNPASPQKSNINQASPIENPSFNLELISLQGFQSRLNISHLKQEKTSKENINSSRLLRVPKSGNKSFKNGSSQKIKAGGKCQNELLESEGRRSKNKSTYMDSAERQLQNVLGDKNTQVKRKKKLQLPEREAKVYQELLKDKLEVLDLGKGFLGNANVLAISELFPSRTRLKAVKLMDNAITDQIFADLLSRCKNVQSLNLSGNQLSEKSLSLLEREVGNLGQLRNITLSLNKIVLRNVKERLQDLKERGLTVSI